MVLALFIGENDSFMIEVRGVETGFLQDVCREAMSLDYNQSIVFDMIHLVRCSLPEDIMHTSNRKKYVIKDTALPVHRKIVRPRWIPEHDFWRNLFVSFLTTILQLF